MSRVLFIEGVYGIDGVQRLYKSASCAIGNNHINLFSKFITANDAEYDLAIAA
jgi:hypothetical protein